jgi:uncharacterized protein YciI
VGGRGAAHHVYHPGRPEARVPLFVYIGHDAALGGELRADVRPAHLAALTELAQQGRIVHAGPMLDEEGRAIGSVILFEADDLAAARRIAARDPYVTRGVFARYEVYETRAVFSREEPGSAR